MRIKGIVKVGIINVKGLSVLGSKLLVYLRAAAGFLGDLSWTPFSQEAQYSLIPFDPLPQRLYKEQWFWTPTSPGYDLNII